MSARKLTGWFLIVMGLARIFQSLTRYAPPGRTSSSLFVFATAFLFTLGAVLISWDAKWWGVHSHTND